MEIRFPKNNPRTFIRSSQIKVNDIIKFEYGTYDNHVTVRIDQVNYPSSLSQQCYSQELIWHYLSDESKNPEPSALSQAGQQSGTSLYRQFTCYSNPNDLVEKLN